MDPNEECRRGHGSERFKNTRSERVVLANVDVIFLK